MTLKGAYGTSKSDKAGGTLESGADAVFAAGAKLDGNFGQFIFTVPWFKSGFPNTNSTFTPTAQNGVFNTSATINDQDTPKPAIPLDMQTDFPERNLIARNRNLLIGTTILIKFELNVCAQTAQTQNGANKVFARQAYIDWQFNGDGTVDATAPPYPWAPAAEAGVTAPAGWAWVPRADGSVPITDTSEVALSVITSAKFKPVT